MEILVVLAIVGLMGLGTTTLVTNMLKLNQRTLAKSNLISVKDMIEKNIKNDDAWAQTICRGNPTLAGCSPAPAPGRLSCLFDGDNVPCTHNLTITNPPLYNRNGEIIYNPGVATSGFTIDGGTCNAFGGNDACPFRYNINVVLVCPGTETQCLKPDVRIDATAVVSTGTQASLANRIDTDDYAISFIRNQEVRYEPLEVVHQVTTNAGGGNCLNGTAVPRRLDEITYDVGNNILGLPGNAGVRLRAGEYDCEVIASGFEALDGFTIEVAYPGNSVVIGTGYSDVNGTATVQGNAEVSLAADGIVRIMHTCGGPNSVHPEHNFERGIPISDYSSGTTFTRFTCIRNH